MKYKKIEKTDIEVSAVGRGHAIVHAKTNS